MSNQPQYHQDPMRRPLSTADYHAQGGDNDDVSYYGGGYGTEKPAQPPRSSNRKKWAIVAAVILVIIIVGAVVGGVVGSRSAVKNNLSSSSAAAASGGKVGSGAAAGGTAAYGSSGVRSLATGVNEGLIVATRTDAFGNPMYPTQTGSAIISPPTTISDPSVACQSDPYVFSNPSSLAVRKEHPLLIAPAYKWNCVIASIPNDPYLSVWNETIFLNASIYYAMPPTNYSIDGGLGGSGVLDPARQVQLKLKHFAYAYRLSNDTKWVDRAWLELQTASGNTTQYFGNAPDNWNSIHFLDLAEFTAAFAIAYDWMYDAWTPTQRNAIMWSIINLGLQYGINSYADPTGAGANYAWWHQSPGFDGNWNAVCNNGLTMGALAIANEDPTGIAARILTYTIPNINIGASQAPSPDGTWSETPNYWYFGTYTHAEMASSLLSATGSTQNLMDSNPAQNLSSLFHMYVTGMQGLFSYGDTGPNKYTATANALLFAGDYFNIPTYSLFQRDRGDVVEPMAMFWYNPQVSGQFFDNLPLDHYFDDPSDSWASMRSTWTSTYGTYVAMKAGNLTGHQTHGDLDCGDFVLDALGQRWAGELASADYLGEGYFSSEAQDSQRWWYYRTRTEGQNTLLLDDSNQDVMAQPTTTWGSTGDVQDSLDYTPPTNSTAFFTIDMSTTYNTTDAKRAIRYLNGRNQILIQDEIVVPNTLQWRMQTNATVTLSNGDKTATLTLNGETLVAEIQATSAGTFSTQLAVASSLDPVLPLTGLSANQPNPGVTVLTIALGAGQQLIQVLFKPQYANSSATYSTPPSVPISSWTLTSHN